MKKKSFWLIIVFLLLFSRAGFGANSDYAALRKFLSAGMYGEAYNELLRQELSGNSMDPKLKQLKLDLLDRTNVKLQKQIKVNPDDAGCYIILADIAFQKGDFDRASQYASTAIANKGDAVANYIFAKILFRKGNINQAFEQMGKVLESMPDSPIIFNDFQFLYTCNQYGVNTAKRITKDSSFLIRATPITYDENDTGIPESPFENDPTAIAGNPNFSDYDAVSYGKSGYDSDETDLDNDLYELDKINSKPVKPEKTGIQPKAKAEKAQVEEPLPDEIESEENLFSDENDPFDEISARVEEEEKATVEATKEPEKDPERVRIEKAEGLLESAITKFRDGYVDAAYSNVKEIDKIYPNLPGKQEIEDKINYDKNIRKRYKEALAIYEEENFDKALGIFKEAYEYKPKDFVEAPFYIGRCYLLKKDPDSEMALKYFDLIVNDPDLNSELKRDLLWTKIEILYAKERYSEAKEIYDYFTEREYDFAKQQSNNTTFKYGLWWHLHSTIITVFGVISGAIVFIVFILQFLPDLAVLGGDPLAKASKALDSGKFEKAVKYGEKALKKKQPIQLDRQLREILVQAYFVLENYEKCQYHARLILKGFPENNIAWGHLAKASVAIRDTSEEAIRMYEDLYHDDPGRGDLLPILAKHYVEVKNTTPAAMEILQDYHRANPEDEAVTLALAEGYVKNRTMSQEVIPVLTDATAIKDKIEYRELLARTFSKCNLYNEAARECIEVLKRSINNIGIHVVYTSSMKKLNQTEKAIEQYKLFISENPGNSQLLEILNGLKKEAVDTTTLVDDVPKLSEELGMPGMSDLSEEPLGVVSTETDADSELGETGAEVSGSGEAFYTPIPDFMGGVETKETSESGAYTEKVNLEGVGSIEVPRLPDDIQTLDPFAEEDPLFEGFDTEELPEELGGTARPPVETVKSLDTLIDDFKAFAPPVSSVFDGIADEGEIPDVGLDTAPQSIKSEKPDSSPKTGVLALGEKVEKAKDLAANKKWDEVVGLLTAEFASQRNRDVGMLLIDAWLGKNNPEMALEIIQTLDFDPEMMSESIKDILYRTAIALEMNKKYKESLQLYDSICNADINYKDAFDRSDKLYTKMKS